MVWSLYVFWIFSWLLNVWFISIFSQSLECLITLFAYFAAQKPFSLMQFHLSIFVFVACAFGIKSKKTIITQTNVMWFFFLFFFLVLLQFQVLHLRVWSILRWIFVYGVRQRFNFILLHVVYLVFPIALLKVASFPHCMSLTLLLKIKILGIELRCSLTWATLPVSPNAVLISID
jgi:hypothetical protein